MQNTKKLMDTIGYSFKDEHLLTRALMHSSYTNEHGMRHDECNERLEFLGDAVLECVSSEYLYGHYPVMPEGELTKLRASLVCEPTLAFDAKAIGLGAYILLGRGEYQTGGNTRDSILSDALEAVIGGIFLDGGFANAKEFILRFVMNDIAHKQLFYDSKTILQEKVQKDCEQDLDYRITDEHGPDHAKVFTAAVYVGDTCIGSGSGKTKKAAEQQAAYEALIGLED